MLRSNPILAQALTEYAGMQLREALGRVSRSVGTLEYHEIAAAVAGVLLICFLLRRGRTDPR